MYPDEMKKQIMHCANEMCHLTDKYSDPVILFALLNYVSRLAVRLELDKDKLVEALDKTFDFHDK